MNTPPPIGPTPERRPTRPTGPPTRRHPPGRLVAAAALGACALIGAVMWISGGSGDDTKRPAERTDTPAITTAPSTDADIPDVSAPTDEPTIVVPDNPSTTAPTTTSAPSGGGRPDDLAPNGRGKNDPVRNVPDRTKQRVPARPAVDMTQVSWPDRAKVASNALDVAQAIANSDGRAPKKLAASVSALVAPNVRGRLVDMFGNGSAAPEGVRVRGQLLSANLQADPHTGARYAIVIIRRTFGGAPTEAIVQLEFAPAQPIITDFDYEPIVSG